MEFFYELNRVCVQISNGWSYSWRYRSFREMCNITFEPDLFARPAYSCTALPSEAGSRSSSRGCHGAIVPAGNVLLDSLRPPCPQHSQAWDILETIWSRHTCPLHTEGNPEPPGQHWERLMGTTTNHDKFMTNFKNLSKICHDLSEI